MVIHEMSRGIFPRRTMGEETTARPWRRDTFRAEGKGPRANRKGDGNGGLRRTIAEAVQDKLGQMKTPLIAMKGRVPSASLAQGKKGYRKRGRRMRLKARRQKR